LTRLAGIEAAADRLRDSTIQLLTADKAYLSKEVQVGGWLYSILFACSCNGGRPDVLDTCQLDCTTRAAVTGIIVSS
jgi:hypothetical protein